MIFCCSLIPYTFGRIGTDGLDRIGALTILVLGFVLPFLGFLERKSITALAVLGLVMAIGIRSFSSLKDFSSPISMAGGAVTVPGNIFLAPDSPDRPPNMGSALVSSTDLAEQKEFQRLLQHTLASPKETYFDLTNQQSYYFIHNRPCYYLYPSHLLAINYDIQSQVIQKLESHPPSLVWIAPAHDHELFKSSLRAYRLYRWVLLNGYVSLVQSDKKSFTFLMKNGSAQNSPKSGAGLAPFFLNEDLNFLPAAWGRNWRILSARFQENATIVPANESGHALIFSFPHPISGAENDFFLLKLKGYVGHVKISFQDVSGQFHSSEFSAAPFAESQGKYLVPIGADPRWLLSSQLLSLRLELPDEARPAQSDGISLLHLVK